MKGDVCPSSFCIAILTKGDVCPSYFAFLSVLNILRLSYLSYFAKLK
jgi:hypothetical protein